jgi:hypothetical protein
VVQVRRGRGGGLDLRCPYVAHADSWCLHTGVLHMVPLGSWLPEGENPIVSGLRLYCIATAGIGL